MKFEKWSDLKKQDSIFTGFRPITSFKIVCWLCSPNSSGLEYHHQLFAIALLHQSGGSLKRGEDWLKIMYILPQKNNTLKSVGQWFSFSFYPKKYQLEGRWAVIYFLVKTGKCPNFCIFKFVLTKTSDKGAWLA